MKMRPVFLDNLLE